MMKVLLPEALVMLLMEYAKLSRDKVSASQIMIIIIIFCFFIWQAEEAISFDSL